MNSLEVVIRSQDRVSGTPEDYTVYIPQGLDLSKYETFYAASVAMRGSRYNINASNNTFYCAQSRYDNTAGVVNHDLFTTTIPVGNYNQEELAVELATAVPAAMIAALPGSDPLTLNVTYNDVTGRYTIDVTSAEHRGLPQADEHIWFTVCDGSGYWNGVYTYTGSLNQAMGFESLFYPPVTVGGFTPYINAASSSFPGNCVASFTNLLRLMLCCDKCTSGIVTTDRLTDVRQGLSLVIEPPFGVTGVWESGAHTQPHMVSGQDFQSLRFFWRDVDSGEVVDLNCAEHTISLRFQ